MTPSPTSAIPTRCRPSSAAHGGKVLARGGRYQVMEGPEHFKRFVVIEFPDFESGVRCFESDEYNDAARATAARTAPARCRP